MEENRAAREASRALREEEKLRKDMEREEKAAARAIKEAEKAAEKERKEAERVVKDEEKRVEAEKREVLMKEAKERREIERIQKEADKKADTERKQLTKAEREVRKEAERVRKEERRAEVEAERIAREARNVERAAQGLPPEKKTPMAKKTAAEKKMKRELKEKKKAEKKEKAGGGLPRAARPPPLPKEEPELPGPPEVTLVGRRMRLYNKDFHKYLGGIVMGCNGHGKLTIRFDFDAHIGFHLLSAEKWDLDEPDGSLNKLSDERLARLRTAVGAASKKRAAAAARNRQSISDVEISEIPAALLTPAARASMGGAEDVDQGPSGARGMVENDRNAPSHP